MKEPHQFGWRAGVITLACALAVGGCKRPTPSSPPALPSVAASSAQAALPNAQTAEVKTFLEGLYAHYKTSKNNGFQMFDADVRDVFDPDMIRLLDADTRALKGDLGAIDGDWLCQCQDFDSLKTTVAVQSANATTAKATVDFVDVGIPGQAAGHDDFDLVKTSNGWRIHDIKSPGQPSLRQTLEDEIRSMAKAPNAGGGAEAP